MITWFHAWDHHCKYEPVAFRKSSNFGQNLKLPVLGRSTLTNKNKQALTRPGLRVDISVFRVLAGARVPNNRTPEESLPKTLRASKRAFRHFHSSFVKFLFKHHEKTRELSKKISAGIRAELRRRRLKSAGNIKKRRWLKNWLVYVLRASPWFSQDAQISAQTLRISSPESQLHRESKITKAILNPKRKVTSRAT